MIWVALATFISSMYQAYSDAVAGVTTRCQAKTKSSAVTGLPSDQFASRRVKV